MKEELQKKELPTYLVIDVEAVGLHGEGYAVGYVVVDSTNKVLEEGMMQVDPALCQGSEDNRDWIKKNIPELPITHKTVVELRTAFWQVYLKWSKQFLVQDCAFPVETNFINACINDSYEERNDKAPYPFLDVNTSMLMYGKHPTSTWDRNANELPLHNPLSDQRQSQRVFMTHLSYSGFLSNIQLNYDVTTPGNPLTIHK